MALLRKKQDEVYHESHEEEAELEVNVTQWEKPTPDPIVEEELELPDEVEEELQAPRPSEEPFIPFPANYDYKRLWWLPVVALLVIVGIWWFFFS